MTSGKNFKNGSSFSHLNIVPSPTVVRADKTFFILERSCARQIATEEARVGVDAVRKNRARNKCPVIEDRRG